MAEKVEYTMPEHTAWSTYIADKIESSKERLKLPLVQ